MGRKGNWFSAVKKALHSDSKEENNQQSAKAKKKWFKKKKRAAANAAQSETVPAVTTTVPPAPVLTPVVPHTEPPKVSGVEKEHVKHVYPTAVAEPPKLSGVDKEKTKHAYSVALATAKAAEAAAEVVRLTAVVPVPDKSIEEMAAIRIQTKFRGYMARRTLRALRGLMRLKSVMQGQAVRRQTTNTLKSMQTLAKMQTQIRERRLKMAEENLARQIQHKNVKEQAREFEKLQQSGDGWDSSGKTKEQIESKMQFKHEAAIRRERTLAYAFSHQQTWKATARSATTLFMDQNNPHWGWSWLERWLAARPWEIATMESSNENSPRAKPAKPTISGDEILKAYSTHRQNVQKTSTPISVPKQPRSSTARMSTSSAPSSKPAAQRKLRSPSPKSSPRASLWGADHDDTRSVQSEQSSIASSQNVPSYMAPTEAAKARSRFADEGCKRDKSVTPDRSSVSSATKRRGSHPASPARSRRSTSSAADVNSDHNI